jgi:hypothetical protein
MKRVEQSCEGPLQVGNLSITAIVETNYEWHEIKDILYFSARKQPVYIVVTSAGKKTVFNIDGMEIPIHQVKESCYGQAAALLS